MRITQGTFSYLPDLNDEEIAAQVQYCLDHDWPLAIEHTDDPHPRNVYWETWGYPCSTWSTLPPSWTRSDPVARPSETNTSG